MGSPTKTGFVKNILAQLGVKVPDNDRLLEAIVKAARATKEEAGLAEGPEVKLDISPLPGSSVSDDDGVVSARSGISAHLARNLLGHLGHDLPDEDELRNAVVAAARDYKKTIGVDPGPRVALNFGALPASDHGNATDSGAHRMYFSRVLGELGYEPEDEKSLSKAMIATAREFKKKVGVDPGPTQQFVLTLKQDL